ncbi:MAG: Rieske (2Fe-2S) protein [Gammaproteobacteria bacterium]|nr:Rieske (2Fe-2S) protein [Gammaproteobacteria bacterium]NND38430.1 Rieske (2Fe-2S) protein [Pseudomonadales bacterium]MBT8149770.1 Rieske (2Fe-2S) protein [Gammaproteobacteria bacterium]NNL10910.1 Rieske (2Fe-2S) protein [Pseudomonadales bacterium]NNM12090.1 Rieske (2Fe-2S) protein [Pseudomonadales bacterium]
MHLICSVSDVEEGQSRGFECDGKTLFVVKKDGALHTYLNRCPHLGIELEYREDEFLDDDGSLIQCSTHGALFSIDAGDCLSGPCFGDRLTRANTRIENNKLYLLGFDEALD